MDLSLSEEQRSFRALAREFLEQEVVPHRAAWDRADITGVRVSSGLRGARLHIHLDGRVVSFDQVRPRSLASEFELLLAPVIEEDASQEGSADAGSARSGTPGDEPSSP